MLVYVFNLSESEVTTDKSDLLVNPKCFIFSFHLGLLIRLERRKWNQDHMLVKVQNSISTQTGSMWCSIEFQEDAAHSRGLKKQKETRFPCVILKILMKVLWWLHVSFSRSGGTNMASCYELIVFNLCRFENFAANLHMFGLQLEHVLGLKVQTTTFPAGPISTVSHGLRGLHRWWH